MFVFPHFRDKTPGLFFFNLVEETFVFFSSIITNVIKNSIKRWQYFFVNFSIFKIFFVIISAVSKQIFIISPQLVNHIDHFLRLETNYEKCHYTEIFFNFIGTMDFGMTYFLKRLLTEIIKLKIIMLLSI